MPQRQALACRARKLYAESANADFKQGQAAEAREDFDTAFDDYQKAIKKNPKDARFKIALARVRVTASSVHVTKGRKLEQAGDTQAALGEFLHAAEIDPSNEAAQQEIARLRQKQGESAPVPEVGLPEPPAEAEQLQSIESPPELKPVSNEPLSLHMAEDSKVVYETVGKAAGINVLFDPDYHSSRIEVDLKNVSLLDALRIVSVMSNTFWRPVTDNTIFVAQNTPTKRRDLDEQAVQTFYLTNAWQQNDLNDVATAIRNVMPTAKAFPVQSQNAIVMRGTPDELLLAQQLIDDLDKPRGEVVVDIAVLEVSKNWEKTLGMQWPSSFGVALQPNCSATNSCSTSTTTGTSSSGSSATNNPTLYNLAHLNSTNFQVTVGSATLNLLLTDNNTKVLQSPRIRATDAQKATMKIGSKIPIATGSYQTGAATALVSSLVNTQFQYQDVGVNIEMTPSVHYDHDVTLKIKIEVSAESGTETISGVTEPIFSQRVVDQVIRLREGEASILGGIQEQPGIAELDRHSRIERHPHPQIHFRLERSHHPGRRSCVRGGAAYRALAGAGSGESARHRHRRGAEFHRIAPCRRRKQQRRQWCPRRAPCRSSARPLERFPRRARSKRRRRCWHSCAPIWEPIAAPTATAQAAVPQFNVSAAQPPAADLRPRWRSRCGRATTASAPRRRSTATACCTSPSGCWRRLCLGRGHGSSRSQLRPHARAAGGRPHQRLSGQGRGLLDAGRRRAADDHGQRRHGLRAHAGVSVRAARAGRPSSLGEAALFNGIRSSAHDFIFNDELEMFQERGVLHHLRVARSRENPERREYVQHKLLEDSVLVWDLLQRGGYVYVCGSLQMRQDVRATFGSIAQQRGGLTADEAEAYLDRLETVERRYRPDVWG